jgi:hypothetical protein
MRWSIIILFFVTQISYAQNVNKITLQKHGIFCDIIVPDNWNIYPNNDYSKTVIAELNPPNAQHGFVNIPSVILFIKELSQPVDIEMENLINNNNQTNIRNKFKVAKENNANYIIYTAVGYNIYSSCLYLRYDNFCIYFDLSADTEQSKNMLLEILINIANNLNPRRTE